MINVQLETDTGNFKDKPSTTDVSVNMTKLQIATGTDDFRKMRSTSDVFVDKTLFIKNIIDTLEEAILIMRPRRWGKTLNLDMLLKFLAIEVDDKGERVKINSNRVLFEGGTINIKRNKTKDLASLKIAEISGEYMEDQGDYPVIFISLKGVRALTYNEVVGKLKNLIKRTYKNYNYLIYSDAIDDGDKQQFQTYIDCNYIDISILEDSLRFLSELLYKHHKQKVYILVDEYDKPVNFFVEHGLDYKPDERRQVAQLITDIMSECGKTNPYLEKIVLTGIFDAFVKEGGSGFNNLEVHDISKGVFGGDFGFSEKEVKDLLSQARLPDSLMDPITYWYNGYKLKLPNQTTIKGYTPWSVMKYIKEAIRGCTQPQSYWEESGVNWMLSFFPIKNYVLGQFSNMLQEDGEIELNLSTRSRLISCLASIRQSQVHNDTIGSLLFNSGYITEKRQAKIDGEEKTWYKLPNKEIAMSFKNTVLETWLYSMLDDSQLAGDLSSQVWMNMECFKQLHDVLDKSEEFVESLQNILNKMGGGYRPEAYFSVLMVVVDWYRICNPIHGKYKVLIESQVPSGGKIDVMFIGIAEDEEEKIIIQEHKILERGNTKGIDQKLSRAMQQILEKKYIEGALDYTDLQSDCEYQVIKIRAVVFVQNNVQNKWEVKSVERDLTIKAASTLVSMFECKEKCQDVQEEMSCTDVYKLIDKVILESGSKRSKTNIGPRVEKFTQDNGKGSVQIHEM